ncbi:MAG: amidohydrolase family protein [Balneolales bacterium]
MNRRKFFENTAVSAAGIIFGGNILSKSSDVNEVDSLSSSYDIMQQVMKYQKIDCHAHPSFNNNSFDTQIEFAQRLGIDKLIMSRPLTSGETKFEKFREANDVILKAMKRYPDKVIGQPTVNAQFQKESLEEIDRCIDQGMVGLKVYNQVKINDPLFYPIIEKLIDLNMIVHMHVGVGNSRVKAHPGEPESITTPDDFAEAAKRYPEAMFQYAHLGGGGDWEAGCNAVRDCPNVYVDLSGSNNEENIVNFALEHIGEDRMLFGCDNSFYQGVGHVLAANLSETQKRKIFFDNYNNILRKAGRHVD